MIEFGKQLREAREAKGYTISQLSEITHMAPTRIADLENENFASIAAPIYGRGFVKLYCQAVGIDPKPMIDEFMEIFSGNRETAIKERAISPAEDSAEPTPPIITKTEFSRSPERSSVASNVEPSNAWQTANDMPPIQEPNSFFDIPQSKAADTTIPEPSIDEPVYSRYATPIRQNRKPTIPSSFWRIALVGMVALALLWAIAIGIRALYRATSVPATENEYSDSSTEVYEETRHEANAKSSSDAKLPSKKRTPQKIPPLYLD